MPYYTGMTTSPDITVLPPGAATEGTHCLAYWDLHATKLQLDDLADAWKAHGLASNLLPGLPSDKRALRRAVDAIQGKFDGKQGPVKVTATYHTKHGLFNLVCIRKLDGGDVETITGLKVFVGEEGDLKSVGDDPCGILGILRARYEQAKLELDPSLDLSCWLVGLVKGLLGVPIRPRGGVYLVLAPYKNRWRRMTRALQEAMPASDVFEIPAVANEQTMHALVAALTKEVQEFAEKTDVDISKGGNRADGLRTKEAKLAAALEKVKTFEKVLDVSLGDLHKTLGTLTGALAKVKAVAFAAAAN